MRSPKPLLKSTSSFWMVSLCFAMRSLKKTSTQSPKMMGSETFIMVAFMWREKRMPCALASAIWASRNSTSALRLSLVASRISPASSGVLSLRTVTEPSAEVNSILTSVGSCMVIDFSLDEKSLVPIVAT